MEWQPLTTLNSLSQTQALGQTLAAGLRTGDCVLLFGEMGAGKTTLVKSMAAALGINPDLVISPTYTMVNIYQGQTEVYHVDLYRLQQPEDLESFDRDDLICESGLTLIEWPELLLPLLEGQSCLSLRLQSVNETTRAVYVQAHAHTHASPNHLNALIEQIKAHNPSNQPH